MIRLVSCITEQHSWALLLVAVCVCTAGNLAAVFMLSRARQCVKAHRNLWLAIAGTVLGGTIWATHFIAMLSYSIPVSYQMMETGLSIVAAVAISCLASFTSLYVPGRQGAVAAGIDDEIRVLRDQLARKLTLQNAQLRKMLERFER
ncbi:MHYT domain-containing protein [Rhizobium sp. WSM1325]|uniref:MHYT domain-containing protein n=1 Tax=Rhizobium sp. WSM1325 TaxID=3444086 RepID=UPI0013E3CBF6|nr:MHYT domain-containing protein [Rhizobium leguminosarum]